MSKKKKKPKRNFQGRGQGSNQPPIVKEEAPETYHILQHLNNELQRSQQLINAVKKEHCQLRDGFIFLISKMNEVRPGIEKELARYYATNHNLSGHIEINRYNIDNNGQRNE